MLASRYDALAAHIAAKTPGPEALLRARVFIWSSALLVLIGVGWGAGHLSYGDVEIPVLSAVLLGLHALSWWKLLRDRNLEFASHALVAALTAAAVIGAYWTGGLRLTNVTPFLMLVVVSMTLLGRAGASWCAVNLGFALLFQIGHWLGHDFPDLVPPETRGLDAAFTWMSVAFVLFAFVWSNNRSRQRLAAELFAANRAKTEFLADVSHELRNPIHALQLVHARLLATEPSPEQRRLLETAEQNAEALFVFLSDLIDLASVERGRFRLQPTDFSLARLVDRLSEVTQVLCDAKGLTLVVDRGADELPALYGDRRRLRQVLSNLLVNAIDYTPRGQILLRIRALRGAGDRSGRWRFEVQDQGVGMSSDELAKIFEPWVRLRDEVAPHGFGRGLAIVRALVTEMGGVINVASEPGQGTTFSVEMPLPPARAAPEEAERGGAAPPESVTRPVPTPGSPAAADEQRKTLLLVDDHELSRTAIEQILIRQGYEVAVASGGEEGFAIFKARRPAVVLIDVRMPGWDGPTTIGHLRAWEKERRCAPAFVIGMTGDATDEMRNECLAAGANECLFKPFGPSPLKALLAVALGDNGA